MSSPPQTPTISGVSFQPSPREPAYTTATYKPPSLYPNKKQRTDRVSESGLRNANGSNFDSPRLPSATLEPRPTLRADLAYPVLPAHTEHRQSRRLSIQRPSDGPHAYHISTARAPDGSHSPISTYQIFRTPDQSSTSATFAKAYPQSQALYPPMQEPMPHATHTILDRQSERRTLRRSSTDARQGYPSRSSEPNHVRHSSCQPGVRLPLSSSDEFGPRLDERLFGRTEYPQTPSMSSLPNGGYENAQPAFFMPSHYEYQHGKARKRSNLPKQSTEIMKTWFDQVGQARFCKVKASHALTGE